VVRRFLLALSVGTLLTGVLAPVVSAARPDHFKEAFDGSHSFLPGELCDFNYDQSFVGLDIVTIFADRTQVQEKVTVTHTNADTGYTLVDNDMTVYTFYEDHEKDRGIFWHLRDASGKLVLVQAGKITFSDDGITHTPGVNPNFREVICTALGGNPAPPAP
jgi:hypothetical protein